MGHITRRDFVNGVALGVAAGGALSPLQAAARGLLSPQALGPDYYPPALTGLRGSHAGSFEVAHAVGREGRRYASPAEQTDGTYDLVVVGGGLSGLAAAWFFREAAGADARILVLDNHDDFGGHAKQVEFEVNGRRLISYGGSQTLTEYSVFPAAAKRLLQAVGFDPGPFETHFDREFPVSMGGYEYPKDPDDPIVVTAYPIETPDRSGLAPRDQFRAGRAAMLARPFAEYEAGILEQFDKVWGPYGMDAGRDVAAITVNRWPHGYAYTYDPLWDPPAYDAYADTGPHVAGRAQMHRISVANCDAGRRRWCRRRWTRAIGR